MDGHYVSDNHARYRSPGFTAADQVRSRSRTPLSLAPAPAEPSPPRPPGGPRVDAARPLRLRSPTARCA